jgi:hypothetical protein
MIEGKYTIEILVTGPDGKKIGTKVTASESTYLESQLIAARVVRNKVEDVYASDLDTVIKAVLQE